MVHPWWWIGVLLVIPPCVAVFCVLAGVAISRLQLLGIWVPWALIILAPMAAWSSAFAVAFRLARDWSPLFVAIIVLELPPIYVAWAHTASLFVGWK